MAALLLDLQQLDLRIAEARIRIREFEPQLEELDEPGIRAEKEVVQLRKRVEELTLDQRRLKSSLTEKRDRLEKLAQRMNAVRNVREEAAVTAETDLVTRALEADEQESFQVEDLIARTAEKLSESEAALEQAMQELEPRRKAILDEQAKIETEVASLNKERDGFASQIRDDERVLYERIQAGGRSISVSPMTDDGACGHCFAMIPLQVQNEIRAGARMVCCESCGVIVAPPLPEVEAPAEIPVEEAAEEAAATGDSEEE